MPKSKLEAAISAASVGFRVFPVLPDTKHPAIENWPDAATTDTATIRRWWRDDPDCNIGIATGDGLLVVDADTKQDRPGGHSLEMLDMLGLPDSYRVATPSGGTHVYLATNERHRNRVDSIPDYPGIDIRGERGYVLAAGSTIGGKPYTTTGAKRPDPAPQWFDEHLLRERPSHVQKTETTVTELDRPDNVQRATQWLLNTAPTAVEGAGGDQTTYEVACRMRDFGLSQQAALDAMLEHWNERQSPPWTPDDLSAKVENAFTYATGSWGALTPDADFDAIDIDVGESPKAVEPAESTATPAIPIRTASSFADVEKPRRAFLDESEMLPERNVAILNGDGATGKSLLAMQLAVAVAAGGRWLGRAVGSGPVLYFSAEDDEDETHIRVKDICAGEGVDLARLYGLHVAVMAGRDCLLATENGSSAAVLRKTKMFDALRRTMAVLRPRLLVLDNLADVFGGNENVKSLARQFIGMLRGLAIEFDCVVLLLAHPSLTGMSSGTGSSGNVAWNNSVRSRLYLYRDKDKDGVETDTNARILEHKKTNYTGSTGRTVEMRWERGRFVASDVCEFDTSDVPGTDGETVPATEETKQARAERIFLDMVARLNRQKTPISPARGANYAPKVFASYSKVGVPQRYFEIAMQELFAKGQIEVEIIGPPSRQQRNIVLARDDSD
jgi:RecA-family ATPase